MMESERPSGPANTAWWDLRDEKGQEAFFAASENSLMSPVVPPNFQAGSASRSRNYLEMKNCYRDLSEPSRGRLYTSKQILEKP